MGESHVDWVPPDRFDEYRVVKALGRGSMGQVWLAHDTVLDRLVAVKFIAELPDRDAVRQRFLTEARAAARVQHPNIIVVYRVGEIGPRSYLISEYVRGDSLDKLARPVAWPRLLEIAIGLARGLAAAHRQGVLHRDLKPANAIVSETGEVKLLDFGLAKLLPQVTPPQVETPSGRETVATLPDVPGDSTFTPHVSSEPDEPSLDGNARTVELPAGAPVKGSGGGIALPSVTSTGAVMGTPTYMPPEAWRGEPATPRSDVYSLGALLYALGAGTPPHRGDSSEAVRGSVLARDAPPLAVVAPGVDPGFAAIVDRCLRRDPTERFPSGDAVREALEALATSDNTAARMLARPPQRPPPHLRRAVFVGAALALALFAYRMYGRQPSPPRGDADPAMNAPRDALEQPPLDGLALAEDSQRIGAAPGSCPGEMDPVPAGTFRMGSPEGQGDPDEHPQHEVTLSAYCIDQTEVTVAAYAACVAARRCSAAPLTMNLNNHLDRVVKFYSQLCNREDRPDHPINCIDWSQAAAYCRWQGKRLPTEAEWEYAARGSDGRVYPWGNEAPNAKRLNMCGDKCAETAKRELPVPHTTPVGTYPEGRSPFGALDMAGNVAEWTADWYGNYPTQAETNPQGPGTGTSRVTRGGGGGFFILMTNRAADRDWPDPEDRAIDLGFRCARGR